jgi:hypothetical protein
LGISADPEKVNEVSKPMTELLKRLVDSQISCEDEGEACKEYAEGCSVFSRSCQSEAKDTGKDTRGQDFESVLTSVAENLE